MKLMKVLFMAFAVVTLAPVMAFAQTGGGSFSDLKPIGMGMIVIGAAMSIGRLASSSVESMARQPEVAGNISSSMITAAALIEGFTFFALLLFLIAF